MYSMMNLAKKNTKMTIPIILCEDTGKQYKFWCPFCRRWHYHSRGDHHAVSHCHRRRHGRGGIVEINSPFRQTGYFLVKGNFNGPGNK